MAEAKLQDLVLLCHGEWWEDYRTKLRQALLLSLNEHVHLGDCLDRVVTEVFFYPTRQKHRRKRAEKLILMVTGCVRAMKMDRLGDSR